MTNTEQQDEALAQSRAYGASSMDDLAITKRIVLKAVYDSGLQQYAPGVLRTSLKDGIVIDEPTSALMNFAEKICKAANA